MIGRHTVLRDRAGYVPASVERSLLRWVVTCARRSVTISVMTGFLVLPGAGSALAQQSDAATEPQRTIQADGTPQEDPAIAERIRSIFREIPALRNVEVAVQAGVVRLSGTTTDVQTVQRAGELVARVDGVVTIENMIERDVSLNSRLTPALEHSRTLVEDSIALLPLLTLASLLFVFIIGVGEFLARRTRLWRRITPNVFIAELLTTTLRVSFIILALVLALNLLGTTALLSAVLGSAGVIGLAVGFAVRDSIENYIASIMLSLRQPFRPREHVIIDGDEGLVIRLTSRATILMTLDGNHLRIPNSAVFKAVVLNYTRNPERRFTFKLGIDGKDPPLAAIRTGIEAMRALDCVLNDPPPLGVIEQVGDSNIVIVYSGWINQRTADFGKSRSSALATVKHALEQAGFGLPEPIYRLRFEQSTGGLLHALRHPDPDGDLRAPGTPVIQNAHESTRQTESLDVTPDLRLDAKVEQERQASGGEDLLNEAAPEE